MNHSQHYFQNVGTVEDQIILPKGESVKDIVQHRTNIAKSVMKEDKLFGQYSFLIALTMIDINKKKDIQLKSDCDKTKFYEFL